MKIEALIEKNHIRGYFLGSGEFIVQVEYVGEFFSLILKENLGVLGIEGFYINHEKEILPNLDHIADFSSLASTLKWNDFQEKSTCSAKRVLEEMIKEGSSNGFCFVLVLKNEHPFDSKSN